MSTLSQHTGKNYKNEIIFKNLIKDVEYNTTRLSSHFGLHILD